MSKESIEKMRAAKLGKDPWNKDVKTGQTPWIAGKHHKPETIERMRLAKLGKPGNHKGHKHSPESIELIRQNRKGKPAWSELMAPHPKGWGFQ